MATNIAWDYTSYKLNDVEVKTFIKILHKSPFSVWYGILYLSSKGVVDTYVIQYEFLSTVVSYGQLQRTDLPGIESIKAIMGKNICGRYFSFYWWKAFCSPIFFECIKIFALVLWLLKRFLVFQMMNPSKIWCWIPDISTHFMQRVGKNSLCRY